MNPQAMQRAYTLRLGGGVSGNRLRECLWQTHEAVNNGARVFGEWLLTFRGGLPHELARCTDDEAEERRSKVAKDADARAAAFTLQDARAQVAREKRVLLALSWLSVESEKGSPADFVVAAAGDADRAAKVVSALEGILRARSLREPEVRAWVADCTASLTARIRDDAVWANRSRAFDRLCSQVPGLTRDEVWDLLGRFFGGPGQYLAGEEATGEAAAEALAEGQNKQEARNWLSNRFGEDEQGADFAGLALAYDEVVAWTEQSAEGKTGSEAAAHLAAHLSGNGVALASLDLDGILRVFSAKGRRCSACELMFRTLSLDRRLAAEDADALARMARKKADDCRKKVGKKGRRAWADRLLHEVETQCSMPYRSGSRRLGEFAPMLDYAARRVSGQHSWVKLAEARRREFEEDARRIERVPPAAREWLDRYCEERSAESGALEPYRIRRRAVDGWKDIVAAWSAPSCRLAEDRVAIARSLQDDPEVGKFDAQLVEALAADDALCVWQADGHPNPHILLDYVAARDAEFKRAHFKVPAYRHPDPLLHPVFCDFGKSRWTISFAAHHASGKLPKLKADLEKGRQAVGEARQKLASASAKRKAAAELALKKAEERLARVEADHVLLADHHAVTMHLWDGQDLTPVTARWQSKRLVADFALESNTLDAAGSPLSVTRADRLGRSVAGAAPTDAVLPANIFNEKDWGARLQAPRAQLEAIAKVRDNPRLPAAERDRRLQAMLSKVKWFLTLSARLRPQGPWIDYALAYAGRSGQPLVEKSRGEIAVSGNGHRGIAYPFRHPDNDKARKAKASHILSRLPGLRVLSVDLGHRCAAACAVWQTLTVAEMKSACKAAGQPPPAPGDLFASLRVADADTGKMRTTVYRRLGPDVLDDGSPHPAPWARLDRQFTIKLQGEDRPARLATKQEIAALESFERSVGRASLRRLPLNVDELMAHTVRTARLALQDHAAHARIALHLGSSDQVAAALLEWHRLAAGGRQQDGQARLWWRDHIAGLPGGLLLPAEEDRPETSRRRQRDLERQLVPLAEALAADQPLCSLLAGLWAARWRGNDGHPAETDETTGQRLSPPAGWHARFRWLSDWVLPRGSSAARYETRNVGGISLTRIATMESLYKVQKAFLQRLTPEGRRCNAAGEALTAPADFGRSVRYAIDRLRENRVKQLASRIAEAALGAGIEKRRGDGGRMPCRPCRPLADVRFAPCHAIVIENLAMYRPEQIRTRRENRQLMSWSSSRVRKHLAEACQLYGIHLREVAANYTSRQDSRTGAPGIRCSDIPVAEFVSPYGAFAKRLIAAADAVRKGKADPEQQYLFDLLARWKKAEQTWRDAAGQAWRLDADDRWSAVGAAPGRHAPDPVRIPNSGGELFVSADAASPAAGGIQADLNAAANIGLRALLDPDWPGRWWYVPCDRATLKPAAEHVGGSAFFNGAPLPMAAAHERQDGRAIVNLWRDPSSGPAGGTGWNETTAYWNAVRDRGVAVLRARAGL